MSSLLILPWFGSSNSSCSFYQFSRVVEDWYDLRPNVSYSTLIRLTDLGSCELAKLLGSFVRKFTPFPCYLFWYLASMFFVVWKQVLIQQCKNIIVGIVQLAAVIIRSSVGLLVGTNWEQADKFTRNPPSFFPSDCFISHSFMFHSRPGVWSFSYKTRSALVIFVTPNDLRLKFARCSLLVVPLGSTCPPSASWPNRAAKIYLRHAIGERRRETDLP